MGQTITKVALLFIGTLLSLQSKSSSIKASAFGFSLQDATICLQKAFDSGADTIIVDNVGQWNVAPVFVNQNGKVIIFENGVLIKALSGRYDINDCVLNISANATNPNIRKNITLIGYGASIQMRKNEYLEKFNGEFRHCLTIDNAENVKVYGLTFLDSGGDGIIIGNASPGNLQKREYCKDIIIKDCRCNNNKRQGLSIISVVNLLVEQCIFENTNGTAPSAGIDIEPDFPYEKISNCIIKDCLVQNNGGNGIQVYLPNISKSEQDPSIKIIGCTVKNNKGYGLYIIGPGKEKVASNILVSNCKIIDNNGGLKCANTIDGRIKVSNTYFKNKLSTKSSLFFFDQTFNSYPILANQYFGGITFLECSADLNNSKMYGTAERAAKLYSGIKGIEGSLYIYDTLLQKGSIYSKLGKDVPFVKTNLLPARRKQTSFNLKKVKVEDQKLHITFSLIEKNEVSDIAYQIRKNDSLIYEQVVSLESLSTGKLEIDLSSYQTIKTPLFLIIIEWGRVLFTYRISR